MKSYKYIPYNLKLKKVASELRKKQTKSELKLWNLLKEDFKGITFNRQKPLGEFIVDFYCSELALIIEVDGSIHELQKERDLERDNYFKQEYGLKTIRISNDEIDKSIATVKKKLMVLVPSLIKEG